MCPLRSFKPCESHRQVEGQSRTKREITTDWFIDAARFSEHLLHGRPCVGGGAVNKVRCKLFSLVGNEMGKQLVHTILGTGKG